MKIKKYNICNSLVLILWIYSGYGLINVGFAGTSTDSFIYDIFAPPEVSGFMGSSIKVSGNVAIVGDHWDSDNGYQSGAAYIYEYSSNSNQWEHVTKLKADDGVAGDFFGVDVYISGEFAIVGAHQGLSAGKGAAYVFSLIDDKWQQVAKLENPDIGIESTAFARAVAINSLSHTVAIGNYSGFNSNNEMTGKVFVYDFNPNSFVFNLDAVLYASDGGTTGTGDFFGFDLALGENRMLIGAIHHQSIGDGAVYVFDDMGNGWVENFKIDSQNILEKAFGRSIDFAGDWAVVSAPGNHLNYTAYVFELGASGITDSWSLIPNDLQVSDDYGVSVSVLGNQVLVGAPGQQNGNIPAAGTAYPYTFDQNTNSWDQTPKISSPTLEPNDRFGSSVAVSQNGILIGEPRGNWPKGGQAHKFKASSNPSQPWQYDQTLLSYQPAGGNFGFSVSISGNRALVGARKDSELGEDAGAAYILEYQGGQWVQVKKLLAADGAPNDLFGRSVSLDGDRALIGAFADDTPGIISPQVNAGSAYVFELVDGVWIQTQKFAQGGFSNAGDLFGFSVSLKNDRALIGTPYDEDNNGAGAVYIYDYSGGAWQAPIKLSPANGAEDDAFGYAVSLGSDRALIGAFGDDTEGSNAGAAYVFDYAQSWSETEKITSGLDGHSGDFFGTAVDLDGDQAIVGSYLDDSNGFDDNGSAYIFNTSDGMSWNLQNRLLASDGNNTDYFGFGVSINGNLAVVGAYNEFSLFWGFGAGFIYMFERDSNNLWTEKQRTEPPPKGPGGQENGYFGASVDLSPEWLLIGSHGRNEAGDAAGGVFLYRDDVIFADGFE